MHTIFGVKALTWALWQALAWTHNIKIYQCLLKWNHITKEIYNKKVTMSAFDYTDEIINTNGCMEKSCDSEKFRRWDEDLVSDFGRSLTRIAIACGLLLLGVLIAIIIKWL